MPSVRGCGRDGKSDTRIGHVRRRDEDVAADGLFSLPPLVQPPTSVVPDVIDVDSVVEVQEPVWKMIAEKSTGDLGRDANGERAVDKLMDEVLKGPAFLTLLLPLPGGRASASSGYADEGHQPPQTGGGNRKLPKENQKLKEQITQMKEVEAGKRKKAEGTSGRPTDLKPRKSQ